MPGALLERRLHFVLGKGGVGKTTVSAALALVLARRGRRTLAIELDGGGRLAGLLDVSGGTERGPRPVAPNLHVLAVDGAAALEEYLGLVVPVKRLLASVVSSRLYQYFVAAAPGLRELMSVGKIYYEATRTEGARPAWDAIVVDAPATGHSLQLLRMPQAARETFGTGLVQREASKIVELLQDRDTTCSHIVTVGEEMPVTESLEMRVGLEELGLAVGAVVVNRLHGRHFPAEALGRLAAAAKSAGDDARLLACVAERAVEESGWATINATHVARLRETLADVPMIELPFLFVEEFGRAELERLATLVEAGVDGARARAAEQGR